jgi:hypothetical protein
MQRRGLLAMVLAAPLAGCARMQKKDRQSRLSDTITAYVGAIRWGNYETAAAFAVPRSEQTTTADPTALQNLRVTGYTVRVNRVNAEGDEADVSLTFTYYQETRGTVNTVIQDATWYFDETRQGWLMDAPLPHFEP